MPAKITSEYRATMKRIFNRNLERKKPIQGIVSMLNAWRNLGREVTSIENRRHALAFIENEGKQDNTPVILQDGNIAHVSFLRKKI